MEDIQPAYRKRWYYARMMRWVGRRLWIVSLVLWLATALVFVRSFWRSDRIDWQSARSTDSGWVARVTALNSVHGVFCVERWRLDYLPAKEPPAYLQNKTLGPTWIVQRTITKRFPNPSVGPFVPLGLGISLFTSSATSGPYIIMYYVVPGWLLLTLLAALPLWRLGRTLLRKRRERISRRVGLCRSCGYDLRATPDVCPECGAVAQPVAT